MAQMPTGPAGLRLDPTQAEAGMEAGAEGKAGHTAEL